MLAKYPQPLAARADSQAKKGTAFMQVKDSTMKIEAQFQTHQHYLCELLAILPQRNKTRSVPCLFFNPFAITQ